MAETGYPSSGGDRDRSADAFTTDARHETALRELLRSPLEEEPRAGRSAGNRGWVSPLVFALGIAAGVGGMLAGAALTGAEEPAATTTATTTITLPVASGPALPSGYSPLGEGYGARVERVLLRPDAVLVGLSFAVEDGQDPAATLGHQGGQWVLEFPDGSAVYSSAVVFDPVARAAATVVFPPFDQDPAGAGLRLTSADTLKEAEFTTAAAGTLGALPTAGTLMVALEETAFALGGGSSLVLRSLALGPSGGVLEWSVEGAPVQAHVEPFVTLQGDTTVTLLADDPFHPFRNRVLSLPPPARAAFGRAALIPLDPTTTDPGADFTVTIDLRATWAVSAPAAASLPLSDAVLVRLEPSG